MQKGSQHACQARKGKERGEIIHERPFPFLLRTALASRTSHLTPVPPVSAPARKANAHFRRRTSHVPYQVVRSSLAVERCPNQFLFDRIQLGKVKSQGKAKLAA